MVLGLLRKQKNTKDDAQERQRVVSILEIAAAQRSKVYVRFDAAASNLTNITAFIRSVDTAGLLLELNDVSSLPNKFIGQEIDCFFRVFDKDNRNREIFYSFRVPIRSIRESRDKAVLLIVDSPAAIEGSQRRKSLRVKPDLQKFSHLALWQYDASGGFDIHKPTVSLPQFKNNLVFLENMSAGGIRILFLGKGLAGKEFSPQKGDRFIVFFTLFSNDTKIRSEFWLVAKTNNVRLDPVDKDVALGLEFIANGTRQADTGKIAWDKVDDNVIEDLAQHIYEWHLALYREKGLS